MDKIGPVLSSHIPNKNFRLALHIIYRSMSLIPSNCDVIKYSITPEFSPFILVLNDITIKKLKDYCLPELSKTLFTVHIFNRIRTDLP